MRHSRCNNQQLSPPPDDVGGLQHRKRLQVLGHCGIILALCIQVVGPAAGHNTGAGAGA